MITAFDDDSQFEWTHRGMIENGGDVEEGQKVEVRSIWIDEDGEAQIHVTDGGDEISLHADDIREQLDAGNLRKIA